jgi:hypothetical protein
MGDGSREADENFLAGRVWGVDGIEFECAIAACCCWGRDNCFSTSGFFVLILTVL